VKATMKSIEDQWNEITNEVGKAKQQAAYRASIGSH